MENQKLLDLIDTIQNGNFDYTVGVSVFSQLSNNRVLIRTLLLKKNEEKLIYELKKLAKHVKSKESTEISQGSEYLGTITEKFSPQSKKKHAPSMDHRSSSDYYPGNTNSAINNPHSGIQSELHQKRKKLYRERGHVHGGLHKCKTDEERYNSAKKLLEIQSDIDKVNLELNQVLNGEIPVKYLKESKTAEEFVAVKNLKIYISRYQKKISSATSVSDKAKYQAKLIEFQKKLQQMI